MKTGKTVGIFFSMAAAVIFCSAGCNGSNNGGDADGDGVDETGEGVEVEDIEEVDETELPYTCGRGRSVLSLSGTWQVEEGELGDTPPDGFGHTVQVPGFVNMAEPAFEEVGIDSELREAFWYRTTFDGPKRCAAAILNVHKAKYGIRVWLNGELLGDHPGSYTLASFDASGALLPEEPNELLIRVGAWLDSVPDTVPAGQDREKSFWLPGIWDDVAVVTSGSPRIVRVKVEPDIDSGAAVVKTTLKNDLDDPATVELTTGVSEWLDRDEAFEPVVMDVELDGGEEKTVEQTIDMAGHRLWSPEDPFLYVAGSTVRLGGDVIDDLETRFGMRKVEWKGGDDYSGRFYLNNKMVYLRGSNITLHRFFDDALCADLPWDEEWVRELLGGYPKQLGWNAFRFSVGRAPNFWYDIADEVGLLIADEFMMWTVVDDSADSWSVDEMAEEFTEWIQESWNHPSIAWWDASNETADPKSLQTVERVRHLDSTRQWENGGHGPPHGPDDPIEDHPYVFLMAGMGLGYADIRVLDTLDGSAPGGGLTFGPQWTYDDPSHPYIINEYAWLWIDRNGYPTHLTGGIYEDLIGPGPHEPDIYRETYAYVTGGMTEFWRANRGYAGVKHFVYLGYSKEGGDTCDNFIDVENLVMEPRWLEYAQYAFAPFGLYIDSWANAFAAGETVELPVQVVNDLDAPQPAVLEVLAVTMEGDVAARSEELDIEVEALGAASCTLSIEMPDEAQYMLFAKLDPDDARLPIVWSRRKIGFVNMGEIGPDPPFE
ncbi:MAG: glycoside hydrolase family 2 TIM barrel-domain containing protein [Pseudomonadota bacterium]